MALAMLDTLPNSGLRTLGADKAYDTRDFVAACRARKVTPHVASNQKPWGGSAIDGRKTKHAGYKISQVVRKRIEVGKEHRANTTDGFPRSPTG